MKIKNIVKDKKIQIIAASGVLVLALAGGGYYLSSNQSKAFDKNSDQAETQLETSGTEVVTTDPQIQDNIEKKNEAANEPTTAPVSVADTASLGSLKDGSLTILLDSDGVQAYVSFYGSPGTYEIEKLVGGTWTVVASQFSYSGSGGKYIDTLTPANTETHYKAYKISDGKRIANSGDTVVTWQEILSKGAFTVPLAE